jgi:orotidine-5'-phosphate decarboxylase
MTDSFNHRLLHGIIDRRSHVCVGLDPDAAKLSNGMRRALTAAAASGGLRLADGMEADSEASLRVLACEQTVLAAGSSAAAFKPNAAFFEGLPMAGEMLGALARLVRVKCPGVLSICDVKRGDIGNTAEQYARAVFGAWGYDAATINPLMGFDAVEPFLRDPERGVFLLCLTSNPGAGDFLLEGDLYKRIAERAVEWNKNGNVGLVVGATRAEHAAAVRAIAPELPFLVPGIGAQGGSLPEIMEAIDAGRNPRFLVNASRSIMYQQEAADAADCAVRIGGAAASLKEEINASLRGIG